MLLSRTLLLCILLANTLLGQEPRTGDRFIKRLEPILDRTLRDTGVPGFAIGVVEDDELVYSRGFGVQKLGGTSHPVTTKTMFHMASITKTFVAAALLQLADEKRIDLDAPVQTYLPYFKIRDQRLERVTIRQMLSHSSGLPDTDDYGWDKPELDDQALERYVRSLRDLELVSEPGEKFSYSNIAYEVLGDVIANVSGQTFESYVEQHILKPAGMRASTMFLKDVDPSRLAFGHTKTKSMPWSIVSHYPYNRAHSPSSNLHSSVEDMSRWAILNLNRGKMVQHQIVPDHWYDQIWEPIAEVDQVEKIGICWFLETNQGELIVKHIGSDDGFLTALLLIPARKIGVIIMINGDKAPLRYMINQALAVTLKRESQIDDR